VLNGGNGNDILNAGTGNDTLNANSNGYESYKFGSAWGQDTINNLTSYVTDGSTSAKGEIDFTESATTDEKLWFVRSGNNLLIDLLDTSDQITVSNWFGRNARADGREVTAGGSQTRQPVCWYRRWRPTQRTIRASTRPHPAPRCRPTRRARTRSRRLGTTIIAWGKNTGDQVSVPGQADLLWVFLYRNRRWG
jgi:Ca2+-binding RTX toxin-like protein